MRQIAIILALLGYVVVAHPGAPCCAQANGDKKVLPKHKPRFTIGKDTTYVTGPLDSDGYIDYAAALNEKLGQGVTPENNANVLLWKALAPSLRDGRQFPVEFFKQLAIDPPPRKGEYFIGLQQYLKEQTKIEPGKEMQTVLEELDQVLERGWTSVAHPHFAGWLKANEKPLALVTEAMRRPKFYSPWWYVQSKSGPPGLWNSFPAQGYRACAIALVARAMLSLGEGRNDEAWQDLVVAHHLGRMIGRPRNSLGWLAGAAIEWCAHKAELAYLAGAKPSAEKLRRCQRDLQRLPARLAIVDMIDLGERSAFLDLFAQLERHGIGHLLDFFGGELRKMPDPLAKGDLIDWDSALRSSNQWFDRFAAAVRTEDRAARRKLLNQIEQELQPLEKLRNQRVAKAILDPGKTSSERGKLLADFWFSLNQATFHKYLNVADRAEQYQQNLSIAVALACYHRERGRYPNKLDALTPDYLPNIPQDLFGARPMTYRLTDSGYLLYSVGVNGKDDGGLTYGDEPYGVDDIVVRMPLPAFRR